MDNHVHISFSPGGQAQIRQISGKSDSKITLPEKPGKVAVSTAAKAPEPKQEIVEAPKTTSDKGAEQLKAMALNPVEVKETVVESKPPALKALSLEALVGESITLTPEVIALLTLLLKNDTTNAPTSIKKEAPENTLTQAQLPPSLASVYPPYAMGLPPMVQGLQQHHPMALPPTFSLEGLFNTTALLPPTSLPYAPSILNVGSLMAQQAQEQLWLQQVMGALLGPAPTALPNA